MKSFPLIKPKPHIFSNIFQNIKQKASQAYTREAYPLICSINNYFRPFCRFCCSSSFIFFS